MPLCALCASQAEGGLCSHHSDAEDKEWAKNNKIMNDGLIRGDWPQRLSSKEREDSYPI